MADGQEAEALLPACGAAPSGSLPSLPHSHAAAEAGEFDLALTLSGGADALEAASDEGAASREDAARDAVPLSLPACTRGDGWRCLDQSHAGRDCTRRAPSAPGGRKLDNPRTAPDLCHSCVPPPEPDQAPSWTLISDGKAINGEKALRGMLTGSPEWLDREMRHHTADAAARAGFDALAAALRAKDSSALRKSHFFALCSFWRYKTSNWVCKKAAGGEAPSRQRRRPAAAPAPAPATVPALLAYPPRRADAAATLHAALLHQVGLYVAATQDDRLHAAVAAEPAAPLTIWNVQMYDAVLPATRAFAATLAAEAAALRSQCCQPQPSAHWWLSDASALLVRTDAHLASVRSTVCANGAGLCGLHAGGAWERASGPDRAAAQVWFDGVDALSRLTCMCEGALASARLAHSLDDHVRIVAELMTALTTAWSHMLRRAEERRAFCVTRLQHSASTSFWPAFMEALAQHTVPTVRCATPRIANTLQAGVNAVMRTGSCC